MRTSTRTIIKLRIPQCLRTDKIDVFAVNSLVIGHESAPFKITFQDQAKTRKGSKQVWAEDAMPSTTAEERILARNPSKEPKQTFLATNVVSQGTTPGIARMSISVEAAQ